MSHLPLMPKPGTDTFKLLEAMLHNAPHYEVWSPNSLLNITAHSRAANLRAVGWQVESIRGPKIIGTRKREYGYRLPDLAQVIHGLSLLRLMKDAA